MTMVKNKSCIYFVSKTSTMCLALPTSTGSWNIVKPSWTTVVASSVEVFFLGESNTLGSTSRFGGLSGLHSALRTAFLLFHPEQAW